MEMMMDSVIEDFFNDRKAKGLKKSINEAMTELEIQEAHTKIREEFDFCNWLPDAARRAGQISLSSHPCTFSHPSGRNSRSSHSRHRRPDTPRPRRKSRLGFQHSAHGLRLHAGRRNYFHRCLILRLSASSSRICWLPLSAADFYSSLRNLRFICRSSV